MTQSSYAPETMPSELSLVQGGARVVRLNLLDENDEPEDLSGASLPKVEIAEAAGETPVVSKSGGDITIEPSGAKGVLQFTLTAVNTAALGLGSWVGQAQVVIGGNTYDTDLFVVRVTGEVVA